MWAFRRCFELAVEGVSLEAPVGEEEEEDGVHMVVLAARPLCLAPDEGPGGLWMEGWGAERWAYAVTH